MLPLPTDRNSHTSSRTLCLRCQARLVLVRLNARRLACLAVPCTCGQAMLQSTLHPISLAFLHAGSSRMWYWAPSPPSPSRTSAGGTTVRGGQGASAAAALLLLSRPGACAALLPGRQPAVPCQACASGKSRGLPHTPLGSLPLSLLQGAPHRLWRRRQWLSMQPRREWSLCPCSGPSACCAPCCRLLGMHCAGCAPCAGTAACRLPSRSHVSAAVAACIATQSRQLPLHCEPEVTPLRTPCCASHPCRWNIADLDRYMASRPLGSRVLLGFNEVRLNRVHYC